MIYGTDCIFCASKLFDFYFVKAKLCLRDIDQKCKFHKPGASHEIYQTTGKS